jgi:heme exporter protein D
MHLSFDVGRYGAYIWPAFGLSALVLGGLIVQSLVSAARWKRELARLQAGEDKP